MSVSRRKFTTEYKVQAAHRVIDSGRSITEVAHELALVEHTLGNWVRAERTRMSALEESDGQALSGAEQKELVRLRKQVSELEKDLAFLGKAAAYFASNPPKQNGLR